MGIQKYFLKIVTKNLQQIGLKLEVTQQIRKAMLETEIESIEQPFSIWYLSGLKQVWTLKSVSVLS